MRRLTIFLAATLAATLLATAGRADPAADALARAVSDRVSSEGRVASMHFKLTNASGQVRSREALMLHSDRGDTVKIAIYFVAPAAIQDTAFLSHDRASGTDEAWLYLPATSRVRRLPASDRGDYFMGTDLTYGDIASEFKFGLEDWTFAPGPDAQQGGKTLRGLSGTAVSPEVTAELGYTSFTALVDPDTKFPVKVEYTDADGAPLKRIEVLDQQLIDGVWTAMAFQVDHLQTGHKTEIHFENMRNVPDLSDKLLEADALALGVPRVN